MTIQGEDRLRAAARRAPSGAVARGLRGFTLAEMLIASTLGAILLVGTAGSAGLFGQQVQALKQEVDDSKERALSSIAEEVRYAWAAETPSTRVLRHRSCASGTSPISRW